MSGFHTATICADCDPPVVAISTGRGSRCPRCGQVDEGGGPPRSTLPDGVLARRVLRDTAVRSDGDARLLAELAVRLLVQSEDRLQRSGRRSPVTFVDLLGDASPTSPTCPHCVAGEPSVWDDGLFHYAHPDGEKLKVCHSPWRERCRRCSADVADRQAYCTKHALEGRAPVPGESP